jgi:hypothetical protein
MGVMAWVAAVLTALVLSLIIVVKLNEALISLVIDRHHALYI